MDDLGLTVRLKQAAPIPLDVDLDCRPGEVIALVGPSGSGKSTALRCVAGLYLPGPDSEVRCGQQTWFNGRTSVNLTPQERGVGLVFQNYALFPHMTAQENVKAAMGHRPRSEWSGRARELLAKVHLDGLEDRKPHQLSGGQQQRVAVARALARDPKVLLLDEPFSAVDRATRQRLYVELAELRRELEMPTVIVTHDLEEASILADRLSILHRGRTLQTGVPIEVKAKPATVAVARLIDMRNIFHGRVSGHEGTDKIFITWEGRTLTAAFRAEFDPGTDVCWCVPSSHILLHRRDRPSMGERENPVSGVLRDVLALGEMVRLTVVVGSSGATLSFSVPTHVARRNRLQADEEVSLSLLAEGIHLMPWERLS